MPSIHSSFVSEIVLDIGCMYKAGFEPEERAAKLAELVRQMNILEVHSFLATL